MGNDCFSPFHFFWSFIYLRWPWRWSFQKLHPVCLAACLCLVSCLFGEGLAERIPQPPLASPLCSLHLSSSQCSTSDFTHILSRMKSVLGLAHASQLWRTPRCLSLTLHLESLLLTHCTSHVRAVRVFLVLQQDDTVNNLPYFLVLIWKWSKDRDLLVFDFHVCSNVGVCAERIWSWETEEHRCSCGIEELELPLHPPRLEVAAVCFPASQRRWASFMSVGLPVIVFVKLTF